MLKASKCVVRREMVLRTNNHHNTWKLPSSLQQPSNTTSFDSRRKGGTINLCKARMSVYNSKKANLYASKREKMKVPINDGDGGFHISEFLRDPFGIEAMLNTSSLQSFECVDNNTYRCVLPTLQLLSFAAAPVIDLRVTPSSDDCVVELLSCKFQGSEILERQNEHFSAFMINRMTWETYDSGVLLEVDVKLNLTLEIYTRPFTLLPTSAVERPGNLMMQALVDKLVPVFMEHLLQDYGRWVRRQRVNGP